MKIRIPFILCAAHILISVCVGSFIPPEMERLTPSTFEGTPFQDESIHLTIDSSDNYAGTVYRYTVSFSDTTALDSSLSLPILDGREITYSILEAQADTVDTNTTISLAHSLKCRTSQDSYTSIFVPNPFHSHWRFTDNTLFFDIAPSLRPYGLHGYKTQEGPLITSVFTPQDTLRRTVIIVNNDSPPPLIGFSPHPHGYRQAITMYWDELPSRDNYKHMTTEDNKETNYEHLWVRLLNQNPKRKMGYLLIMNRILFRKNAKIPFWNQNSPAVIPDSLDEVDGTWCLHMKADTQMTLKTWQDIPCEPQSSYTLSYWMKTDSVTDGFGAYGEVYLNNSFTEAGTKIHGSTPWQQYQVSFETGSTDTTLRIYLRMEQATGWAFFDQVRLIKDNSDEPNYVQNNSFEENRPYFWYDTPRRNWVDAHHNGLSLVEKAPEEYFHHLNTIENDILKYGWEDRVRLGSHGYHHTPNMLYADDTYLPTGERRPGWEFQWYRPAQDSLVLHTIFTETREIGLSRKSLRYWRSPGFKYTKSLTDILIDSGFVFMDPGMRDYNFQSLFLQRNGKRMWL
ncbi:MAG: hypothetical protein ACQEQ4_11125, partial [Fibrobacterota bacterium]